MIVLYTGRRGCGKTLSMIKDAYKLHEEGLKIYGNIETSFSEYVESDFMLNIHKTDLTDIVLLIDEIQTLIDSRRSARKGNVDFSYFIQQIRKRRIIILCTTQFTGTIDLRLRQHVDILARPKYDKELRVCEVTYIDLTSINDTFLNVIQDQEVIPNMISIAYDAEQIFSLYDTNKIIRLKEKEKKIEHT